MENYIGGTNTHRDDYPDLGYDIAGTQYDVAHVKWGGSWMMPSENQLQELVEKCTYKWTSVNGVYGSQFTGLSGGMIFLPAAGYRSSADLSDAGSSGKYRSSTRIEDASDFNVVYCLNLISSYANWRYFGAYLSGCSVRPISK